MQTRTFLSFNMLVLVAALSLAKASTYSSYTPSYGPSYTSYPKHGGKVPNFTSIGTVEGKTYFAEQTSVMTSQDASSFCYDSYMHLATVTSVKQKNTLDYAYWSVPDGYWTGGRDSRSQSQFSWEYGNEFLSPYVTNFEYYNYPVLTCVYYYTPNSAFGSNACIEEMRPLCEFIHGKWFL